MALELFFVSVRTNKRHHHQACFLTFLTSGDTGEDEAANVQPLEGAGQQREAWGMAGTTEGGPMPTVTVEDGGEGDRGRREFNSHVH